MPEQKQDTIGITSVKQPIEKSKPIKKPIKPDEIKVLYEKLSKPIDEKFLIKYTEDKKEFVGYHAQYAINLLNKEVGLKKWFTTEKILKEELIGKAWVVAMKLTLIINIVEPSKSEYDDIVVTGYGASYARRIENAYKGAKTSAFKNACRYLGIGNELYLKGFEDDIVEELTYEKVNEEPIPDEIVELEKKINEAKNVEQLTSLQDKVEAIEGKSTKAILFKKFNEKKLSL